MELFHFTSLYNVIIATSTGILIFVFLIILLSCLSKNNKCKLKTALKRKTIGLSLLG